MIVNLGDLPKNASVVMVRTIDHPEYDPDEWFWWPGDGFQYMWCGVSQHRTEEGDVRVVGSGIMFEVDPEYPVLVLHEENALGGDVTAVSREDLIEFNGAALIAYDVQNGMNCGEECSCSVLEE